MDTQQNIINVYCHQWARRSCALRVTKLQKFTPQRQQIYKNFVSCYCWFSHCFRVQRHFAATAAATFCIFNLIPLTTKYRSCAYGSSSPNLLRCLFVCVCLCVCPSVTIWSVWKLLSKAKTGCSCAEWNDSHITYIFVFFSVRATFSGSIGKDLHHIHTRQFVYKHGHQATHTIVSPSSRAAAAAAARLVLLVAL